MEISGKGLLQFDQETSSLIGNQTYHRTKMISPYQPNSCYESDYECICIMINVKTCSVPLNILSSVFVTGPTEAFHVTPPWERGKMESLFKMI